MKEKIWWDYELIEFLICFNKWNEKNILNLDGSKVTQFEDTRLKPSKKILIYIFALTNIINTSFQNGFYPEMLKIVRVYPIFLKTDNLGKENCGPAILFFHICHRFLKDWCLDKTTITWHGDNLSLFFN